MRRITLIATAIGMLVLAGAAFAATQINTYTAKISFTSKKPGSAAKPLPIGFNLNLTAKGNEPSDSARSAVLEDIKTTIYGVRVDGKDFPTCSLNKIAAAKDDTVCPKAAEVASGAITAAVGADNTFQTAGAACDPDLDVWNSGQGKLTFFFVDTPTHQCLGGALHTGSTGPYPATYKVSGKNLLVDVPVPNYVSFPAPGLAGSLETEHLVFAQKSAKLKGGKKVSTFSSVACQGKKRPYSTIITANLPSSTGGPGTTETDTVPGTAPCK